jgi:hypothetical protein
VIHMGLLGSLFLQLVAGRIRWHLEAPPYEGADLVWLNARHSPGLVPSSLG